MGKNGAEVIEYGGDKSRTELKIIFQNLKKWDVKYKSAVNISNAEFSLKILQQ